MATEKNLEKQIQKSKEADKKLTIENDKAYDEKHLKEKRDYVQRMKTHKGTKEKVIERRTYHNGVIKNKLVGTMLNGRIIYGRQPEKKHGVL